MGEADGKGVGGIVVAGVWLGEGLAVKAGVELTT